MLLLSGSMRHMEKPSACGSSPTSRRLTSDASLHRHRTTVAGVHVPWAPH